MAKGSKDSNGGCAPVVVGFFILFALLSQIPKPVWIALGVVAAISVLTWVFYKSWIAWEKSRAEAQERERSRKAAQEAAAAARRAEQARRAKQELIDNLGAKNAARVESARAAVSSVIGSEAARAGWLGDVDFTADIRGIVDSFGQAHALRRVSEELSALEKPSIDDRRILGEAESTAADLERAAAERVELIERCATEARLIDESLRNERKDARTAEQRAQLHAKLSSMLYGIEAAPPTAPTDSAADAVIARVQAYREIKNQIHRTRDGGLS